MSRADFEQTAKQLEAELGISAEALLGATVRARLTDAGMLGHLEDIGSIPDIDILDAFNPNSIREKGYSTRFRKWRGMVKFRPDELTLWTGYNGHGKTLFLSQILLDLMEDGAKICIASLEMNERRLIHRMFRQASGDVNPPEDYLLAIKRYYANKFILFKHVGSISQKEILQDFEIARKYFGVDVFVIDSLMKCGLAEDDYNEQKRFVDKLCEFKSKFNCHIHLVAHPRKGSDEKGAPGKLDIKGTGTITDLADNCFSVWRNKIKEEKIEQNEATVDENSKFDGIIRCNKQRNGEWEGILPVWFHKPSMQYLEYEKAPIHNYVPYSRLDDLRKYL